MADRKLLAVIRREYTERVRSKWFVIGTVFGPIFFGTLMVLPALLTGRNRDGAGANRIVILDATGVALGSRVAGELAGGLTGGTSTTPRVETVTVGTPLVAAESLATKEVVADRVKGYLVLDAKTLATGAARYAGSNTTALFDMQRLERAVQRELLALKIEQSGIDAAIGTELATLRVKVAAERLSKRGRGGSGQVNFVVGLVMAVLVYVVTIIYGMNVMRGVLEEKQTRVAEVVLSSIKADRLLLGKVIGIGGVGFSQVLIWLASSTLLWRVRAPLLARFGVDSSPFVLPDVTMGSLAILLAFFLLGFTFYAGLFASVGAMVNSEQEAQQAQMPVVLLLVSAMLVVQSILMQPDGSLARLFSMLPHSAPVIMPLRMTMTPVPPIELAISLASVAVAAMGSLWIGGRIYRVGLLMYGKRPTFPELLTWIRRR